MEIKEKVITYIIIFLLLGTIAAIGTMSALREKSKLISALTISGHSLLNESDYLSFTEFTQKSAYEKLKLSDIKKRFDLHPYIKKSDVIRNADNSISVKVTEKTILAQLIREQSLYLITDERETIKLINGTTRVDYPVLSNLPEAPETVEDSLKLKAELKLAVNIVKAFLSAGNGRTKLAEVDLRKGNEIIVHLENFPAFIKLGRGNYAAKIASIISLLESDRLKAKLENALYVDARYSARLYIGNYEESKVAI